MGRFRRLELFFPSELFSVIFLSFFFFPRVLQGRDLAQSSITSYCTTFNGIKVLRSNMAGRNVGKLFQRVCQPSKNFIVQSCQAAKPTASPRAKNPLWLLAAAPFVNDSLIVEESQMVDEEEEDYEYEYEKNDGELAKQNVELKTKLKMTKRKLEKSLKELK